MEFVMKYVRCVYQGESRKGEGNRFLVMDIDLFSLFFNHDFSREEKDTIIAKYQHIVENFIEDCGYNRNQYDGYGHGDGCTYWIQIEDKEEFRYVVGLWKDFQKGNSGEP
jgi:hypothetical protein